MEQAKKRDHKIFITDIAIDRVPYVEVKGLSEESCKAIQNEHKAILRIAQKQNDSNEVLTIMNVKNSKKVCILGDEFKVNASNNPEAISLFNQAEKRELMYLHNHPSTNNFSLVDIGEFIRYGSLGLLSVVTNQGKVYIIYKSSSYNFNIVRNLMTSINLKRKDGFISHNEAVKEFLRKCHNGGVIYAKSN